jgi:hypothetical protein
VANLWRFRGNEKVHVTAMVNPDVWMGSERTAGIRVRIPTGTAPSGNRPSPAPKPTTPTLEQ